MKKTGFGRYTREQWMERVRKGLDWQEEVRLADLERIREKINANTESLEGRSIYGVLS